MPTKGEKNTATGYRSAGLPGSGSELAVESFATETGTTSSGFSDFVRRYRKNRLALIGSAIILFWLAIAIFGPLLVEDPTDPRAIDFANSFRGATQSRSHSRHR